MFFKVSKNLRLVGFWACLMLTNASYAMFGNSTLFKSSEKSYQSYELILGAVQYIDDKEGNEGYSLSNKKIIQGRFERKVFDYSERDSAEDLYKKVVDDLNNRKFKMLFSCEKENCGDVKGWKLYLDKSVAGTKQYQFYIAAEKKRVKRC